MSYLAPRPDQSSEQFARLLSEKVGGNRDSIEKVEALIQQLRSAQAESEWESSPPNECANGRIPHC